MTLLRTLLLALIALALPSASAIAQQKAAPNWVTTYALTPEGGVRQGNPNAPLKLVEYGSRTCPTCKRFADEGVPQLRANYIATGKVSYEFREFWVHPQDPGPSVLGKCVPLSRFFPLLDAMFAEQAALNDKMTEEVYQAVNKLPQFEQPTAYARRLGYIDLLKRRGMTEARALQCLGDRALLGRIEREVLAGVKAGVEGTPTFFLNGRKLQGAFWGQIEPELR